MNPRDTNHAPSIMPRMGLPRFGGAEPHRRRWQTLDPPPSTEEVSPQATEAACVNHNRAERRP